MASASLPGILLAPWWMPLGVSSSSERLDRAMQLNLWIVVTLFVAANALLILSVLLRRRITPSARVFRSVEFVAIAAFSVLLVALTVYGDRIWAASRFTGADPAALQVEVTGVQFAWYFRYPGPDARFGKIDPSLVSPAANNPLGLVPSDPASRDDFLSSQLVLPANREVDLRLKSQDVIHGFAIPAMRIKQNAVPGQVFHIHFTPTTPGAYAILCTQVCGLGHYRMQASLLVLPAPDYDRWAASHHPAEQP